MSKSWGVGIIGAGAIAEEHVRGYGRDDRCTLVGVADRNTQRARMKSERWGCRGFDSVEELLASPEVTVVSICTWNDSHADLAVRALRAGKHVLVEKPMSRTVAEAEAMETAARETGCVLQVGLVRRHSDNVRAARKLIDAGLFGSIHYAKATCLRRAGNPGGWFADREISGGGPLMDLGVHVIDLAWFLMGCPAPVSVSARSFAQIGGRGNLLRKSRYRPADAEGEDNSVEDLVAGMIEFDNDAVMMVDCSYSIHATADRVGVEIYGGRGGAIVEPQLSVATEMDDVAVNVEPQFGVEKFDRERSFAAEMRHFLDVCEEKQISIVPPRQGVTMMRMIDAMYRSAEIGGEVRLDQNKETK